MDFIEECDLRDIDRRDGEERDPCPHCRGRGYLTVDSGGAGPAYDCPDCGEVS